LNLYIFFVKTNIEFISKLLNKDLEALRDISENESTYLHEILSDFIKCADQLAENRDGPHSRSFRKLVIARDLMKWTLKDIKTSFETGKLKEMDVDVINRYITSLFSESANRSMTSDFISKGHPS
jgi:hypothetical protein